MDRTLGTIERHWWRLGLSVAANSIWIANLDGPLSEDVLRQALAMTQRAHPLLSVRIDSGKGEPRFVTDPQADVPLRVINRTHEDTWIPEAHRELNQPIPAHQAPLLRVIFVKGQSTSDIIINFHHVIVDGSGAFVFRDLLSFCGQLMQGAHPTVQSPGLPPLIERQIPKEYRGLIHARRIVDFLKRRMGKRSTTLRQIPQREPDCPLEKRTTRFLLHSLSRQETQELIEVCRKHKTTFYGATAAAFLLAANRQIGLRDRERMALSNAISLRSYLEPPLGDEICCCAVGGIVTSHSLGSTTDFWDLAISIRTDLRDAVDRGELFYPGFLLRKIFLQVTRSQERYIRACCRNRIK